MKTNINLKRIIRQYKDIIAKDGEVERAELKKWLMLDFEIDDKYKTTKNIQWLIEEILKPEKPTRQQMQSQRMCLYEQGMTDEEIADIQEVKPETIKIWRCGNKLKINKKEPAGTGK